jgi:wyosine [tRNA(Phe)-imidazoG37] synthetase (radical SAM superfamily)
VQLNTVTRPPAESFATAVSTQELNDFAAMFGPSAEVACSHTHHGGDADRDTGNAEDDVLSLLRRRPCTAEDVSAGLSIHRVEAIKILDHLAAESRAEQCRQGGRDYYRVAERT